MPSYVIGLDLGQRSVKAAVLKGAFRGYQVEDFLSLEVEQDVTPAEGGSSLGPETIAPVSDGSAGLDTEDTDPNLSSAPEAPPTAVLLAAQRILETINLPQATVVASVPSDRVSSWVIELPFTAPARVAQTIEFEIENYVPWDLDEVIFDYQTLDSDPPGARLLTAMATVDAVRNTLGGLRSVGVEPLHLASDAVVLARLLPHSEDCEVILDLGSSRTLLCAVHRGLAVWIRCLDSGVASFGEGAAGRAEWLGQVRASLIAAEQSGTPSIERVHVCGGAARHEGLLEAIEGSLDVPTATLELPESPSDAQTAPLPEPEHALAYALALKGFAPRASAGICFRKGIFAHQASRLLSAKLGMAAVAALVLLAVSFISMHFVNLSQLRADLEQHNTELTGTVLETFPDVSPSALQTADGAISILQEQVYGLQWRVEALRGAENSPLTLLRQLSNTIPGEIEVNVDEYLVNSEMVRIRGTTDSFGSIDKIEAAILEHDMFQGAKKSDVNKSRDGKMRFVVTIPRSYEGQETEG
jgi:Tfp pilus assembly PilM family ATPase